MGYKKRVLAAGVWVAASMNAYAAPPDAVNLRMYQDFDEIPVTAPSTVPSSGMDWKYTSARTNPNDKIGISNQNVAGWYKLMPYVADERVHDKFSTYDTYGGRRVYSSFQYLQISDHAVKGHSLELRITGGVRDRNTGDTCGKPLQNKRDYLDYLQEGIDPVCRNNKYYLGEGYLYISNTSGKKETPFEAAQGANRFTLYIKMPKSYRNGPRDKGQVGQTINLGPYSKVSSGGGGHFYHFYYNEGGGWVKVVMDTHPQHNNVFLLNGSPGYTTEYFDKLYKMYILVYNSDPDSLGRAGGGFAPYSFYFDEWEYYYDPEPQNDQTINSPGIVFHPDGAYFDVGFNDKYWNFDSPARYEIKYSFSPITNANYDNAKYVQILSDERYGIASNDQGQITKPSPYRAAVWAPFRLMSEDQKKLVKGMKVYFAVKDISNRNYALGEYDAVNDLRLVEVPGIGNVKNTDLIYRLDYVVTESPNAGAGGNPIPPASPAHLTVSMLGAALP